MCDRGEVLLEFAEQKIIFNIFVNSECSSLVVLLCEQEAVIVELPRIFGAGWEIRSQLARPCLC